MAKPLPAPTCGRSRRESGDRGPTRTPRSGPAQAAFGEAAPPKGAETDASLRAGAACTHPCPPGKAGMLRQRDLARGPWWREIGGQHPGDRTTVAGQPAWPCPSLRDYHPAGESILILFNPNQG